MIRGFVAFGRALDAVLKIVFVLAVIEYFTGALTALFGSSPLDPIIADDENSFRALEVAGAIGIMLCGAFPMVYLIRRYLSGPLGKLGQAVGLSADATAGLLAASANVLALLGMVKDMRARDKVLCLSYGVCAAFLFGDHLSFTANFQPTLIVPVLLGKLSAGICAICLCNLLAVRKAEELEAADLASGLLEGGPEPDVSEA